MLGWVIPAARNWPRADLTAIKMLSVPPLVKNPRADSGAASQRLAMASTSLCIARSEGKASTLSAFSPEKRR